MKKKLKWFTLVEILIVIVIIGILIWALVPRMSAAQGRARDVARKNDLSNLQAAIVVAYQDLWRYPCTDFGDYKGCNNWVETKVAENAKKASDGIDISHLKKVLEAAWMNTVPTDPLGTNKFYGLWDNEWWDWEYRYITMQSNWIDDWWFVVMAKTEVAWWSNWVVCLNEDKDDYAEDNNWKLDNSSDVKDIKVCETISDTDTCSNDWNWNCTIKDETELRYIMTY